MKTLKRITALVGAFLLIALYASTLILAMIGSDTAADLLRIAVVATIIVPVLLWAYSLIYRVLKQRAEAQAQYAAEQMKKAAAAADAAGEAAAGEAVADTPGETGSVPEAAAAETAPAETDA